MKFRNTLLLILAAGAVLSTSSCLKSYTCQCITTYDGYPGLPDSTITEYKIYNSKAGAESICKDASIDKTENGIKTVEACKLY